MLALLDINKKGRRNCMEFLLAGLLLGGNPTIDAAARGNVHIIRIEAMQFSPQIVEVKVGDTVIWKNADPFPHTATADNRVFTSGNISTNHSWRFVARKKGTFPYSCALHPTMKGILVVN